MMAAVAASIAGLVLLAVAANSLVKGAARLALVLGRSPVIVGTVVIGLGTSSPELFISGVSAAQGSLDIAVGNVIGSNIANLSLVLGSAAVISVVPAATPKLRREVPLSAAAVVLFAALVQDGLSTLDGLILIAALAVSLIWLIRHARDGEKDLRATEQLDGSRGLGREVVRTVAGLAGTIAGAQLLVWGARIIASNIGMSEGVIGVTMVAIGTSLPELVTSIQAARRNETELIAGALVGSSLFNSLAVAGAAALIGPGPLAEPSLAGLPVVVMVGITIAAYATMITRRSVGRLEGILLVAAYLAALPVISL